MIVHDPKFILIHIPKTGGSSIEKLYSFKWSSKNRIDNPFHIDRVEKELEPHLPARVLQRSFPDTFKNSFKAAFVRNSWEYVLSAYFWLKKYTGLRHEFNYWVQNEFIDTRERENYIFMRWCQLDWITNEAGNLLVDFIGRTENLQRHFDFCCEMMDTPTRKLKKYNRTLHWHYSHYYNEKSIEQIKERYRKDIEFFGFEFDRPASRWSSSTKKIYPPILQ